MSPWQSNAWLRAAPIHGCLPCCCPQPPSACFPLLLPHPCPAIPSSFPIPALLSPPPRPWPGAGAVHSPQSRPPSPRKYEEVYEPIEDRSSHYIKLIDMVTGAVDGPSHHFLFF